MPLPSQCGIKYQLRFVRSLLAQRAGLVDFGGQFLDARHDAALLGEGWQGDFNGQKPICLQFGFDPAR